MKITATDPETGAEFRAESKNITSEFLEAMSDFEMTDERIRNIIDNLDVSADVKSLLYAFSKATIKVGEYVLKIGRKIIDFICTLFKEYHHATFGMIFGAIVGFLVSTIPVIGHVLGPIVTPILMAFGLAKGLVEDLKDKELERKIAEITARFSPLKTV